MGQRFEYSFDEAFLRAAIRRDLLWIGYLGGAALACLAFWERWADGHWHAINMGVLCGSFFVVGLIHWKLHRSAQRIHELWLTQSPNGTVQYVLDDDGFDVVLGQSRSRFEWQNLRQLWRYNDVWILEIVRMQSVFFPPGQASPETLDFIVDHCREAGVRIKP